MDAKRNPGIGYILSDDDGVMNPMLKGLKRTSRENEVCRNQTDENLKLNGLQSDKYTKVRNVEQSQMGALKEGVGPRGHAHNNVRTGKGGKEMVIKVAGCAGKGKISPNMTS